MTAPFIPLHVHSVYSLLEGALKIKKLISLCKELKMPAVAVTDTNNLFGAMEFSVTAAAEGIQPIIGLHLKVSDKAGIVLLAQNYDGYKNLMSLSSRIYVEEANPFLSLEALVGRTDGLICLTGGKTGILDTMIKDGLSNQALETLHFLKTLFPGRLYIELQRYKKNDDTPFLIDWAYSENIPLVATNEVFFSTEDMFEAHDAFLCIAEKTYVDTADRKRLTPEYRFKTQEEMRALFADLPEAIEQTSVIAKRCAFIVPRFKPDLPHAYKGVDENQKIAEMAKEGLAKRLTALNITESKPYDDRLIYELSVIKQMGFSGYFLIVADFIQWAKAKGIPVGPGRGSGAGSVVAWSLFITDLNPLPFNLLFERFLNPERVSMPDFDIDFCRDRREEVINYVRGKYGKDHVAQIITFGKLQAKAVIRDVGRVLQVPYPVVDKLSKQIPAAPDTTLESVMEEGSPFMEMVKKENLQDLLDIAVKLEGLYRNASTHAAGIVIGNKPLTEIVALYRDPGSDIPAAQFNMKWIEETGLVKYDFLGLKTLTVIAETIKLLKEPMDISTLPLDDPKVFDLLKAGDTTAVFQLESAGFKDMLRKLKPDSFEDIIALVALYRPGPMENIPLYISRKHGLETPEYYHPMLENILKETYGIMIYQEQVMQIAQVMANYSLGAADLLRRAMGKKKPEEMAKQRSVFIDGAVKNSVEPKLAEHVFNLMEKFASYGFNKSHAACYALLAYQTAYLKAHYPKEFYATNMSIDLDLWEKLAGFKAEAEKAGIKVLPPDVTLSDVKFTVEKDSIRYALAGIRGVGEGAVAPLVLERKKRPFSSFQDFLERSDSSFMNKKTMEALIKAGAFDSLHPNRAELLANLEKILAYCIQLFRDRSSNQSSLFAADKTFKTFHFDTTTPMPLMSQLKAEAEAIGFYLSAHPLDHFAVTLEKLRAVTYHAMEKSLHKTHAGQYTLAGLLLGVREKISKTGKRFAILSFSDQTENFDILCFSETLKMYKNIFEAGKACLLTVSAELRDEGAPRLTLQRAELIDDAARREASGLMISFDDTAVIDKLKNILDTDPLGRCKVYLVPRLLKEELSPEILLDRGFALSAATREALRHVPGLIEIKEI